MHLRYYAVALAHILADSRLTTKEREKSRKNSSPKNTTMYGIGYIHSGSIRIQLHNLWLLRSAFAVHLRIVFSLVFLLLYLTASSSLLLNDMLLSACDMLKLCSISLLARSAVACRVSLWASAGPIRTWAHIYIFRLDPNLMIARSRFVSWAIYFKSQKSDTRNVLTQFRSSAHTRRMPRHPTTNTDFFILFTSFLFSNGVAAHGIRYRHHHHYYCYYLFISRKWM